MNREDRDLLLDALAIVKDYHPTSKKRFRHKMIVIGCVNNRLNRRRTWWERVRNQY